MSDHTQQNSARTERVLFLTGRLAEPALRRVLRAHYDSEPGEKYEITVMGISVAALMHVDWILRKNVRPNGTFDRVILPGWCQGDTEKLARKLNTPVQRGPKDLFDLPAFLSGKQKTVPDLDRYDTQIVAEINHAPHLSDDAILSAAHRYANDGADIIDIGCVPGESWARVGEVVRRLVDDGLTVSVDSFDRDEVERAVEGGASLVFSANSSNRDWLADLGAEVVAIPDDVRDLDTLAPTVEFLQEQGCVCRIDPILEPIGFGFTESLSRYYEARRRWPTSEILMGIGNVTELTEVDTAGMNMLLAAICQELNIRSVLTTEVINWARSAVREFDFARRIIRHSIENAVLPKHVDSRLVLLRDPRVHTRTPEELSELATRLTDPGFRIFVEGDQLHLMNRDGHWRGSDPFVLFEQASVECTIDAEHAFYLGYEFAKAVTAMTLGKQYNQDQALSWGMLTVPEISAHDRRRQRRTKADE